MDGIRKALNLATKLTMVVSAAGLLLMMLVVVLDVTLKYLINKPIPGTLEMVSYYFMAACTFLPFAYVQKFEQHIVMTLATERLSPITLRILTSLVYLVSAAYLGVFAWASAVEAVHLTQVGESSSLAEFDVLIWPARWCVPSGSGLMACWMVFQSITSLFGERE